MILGVQLLGGGIQDAPGNDQAEPAERTAGEGRSVGGMTPEQQLALRTRWGIEVVGLRLTAGGHMLDFRYRLYDAEKGQGLFGGEMTPIMTNLATGDRLEVPRPPKIGPLKQTRNAPIEDRTYFILFGNPGDKVKSGSSVSLELGDLKIDRLIVQ